jgi:hypothetical protein
VKDRAAALFLTIPGVTAVGLGGRERDGRPTGEVVLKIFVARKRPAEDLTPGETLPPQFEGVGVDVCEMPEGAEEVATAGPEVAPPPQPAPPPGSPEISLDDRDQNKYRPLRGGGRLQIALNGSTGGTLGCLLWNTADANKIYALTNYHVVVPETGGATPVANTTRLGQPTDQDGPTKCCSHIIGTFVAGGRDTIRDAALIQLDPGAEWLAEITEIGPVAGIHTVTVAEATPLTYRVRKRGERTRVTGGIVESVNTTDTTDGITRHNVMIVKPNPNPAVRAGHTIFFSDKGDSGSAVVNDANEVVALHFAGATAGTIHKGKELPIADIISQFQTVDHLSVAVATATRNGVVNKVPGAQPVAAPRELALPLTGALPPYSAAMVQVGADLNTSAAGRQLRSLWLDHHEEILELVNHRRRVSIAWHRDGGQAMMHRLIRMAADPTLAMPATVHGEPPMRRIEHIHAVFHANASPELRHALGQALAAFPDPATLTYDQVLTALAAR